MNRCCLFLYVLAFFGFISCKTETYYTISTNVTPKDAGVISVSPVVSSVLEGASVTFSAQSKGDYVFTGWSGGLSGTENPKTVTVTSDLAVTANFVLREYPLSIIVEGEGSVSERVISTKTDYPSGTVVELTAMASDHWLFDHWEGDLEGVGNPTQLSISSPKSVTAVFTKKHYAYNLTIVGPGVVDEYLVEDTKATLKYGTKVLLKAYPSDGAIFKGWSGDLTGSDAELYVDIDNAKNITATFEKIVRTYPQQDLMQPSVMLKNLCPGFDFRSWLYTDNVNGLHNFDYNQDGLMDLIVFDVDWSEDGRFPIRFYLGNETGDFVPDDKNNHHIIGLNNNRKTITGDYNGDGKPDFFLIGHGYDNPPWPGEYPIVLLSQPDGRYQDLRLSDYVSFYHGGASADYDNDGDLDVVLVDGGDGKEILFVNDGTGNFAGRCDLLNHDMLRGKYTAELYDLDRDGYYDFVAGLDDYLQVDDNPPSDYNNTTVVFWGNGIDFNGLYTCLPKTSHKGMGLVLDYDFYDVDGDGKEEIVLVRTGDSVFGKNYEGWALQVVKRDGRDFSDITDEVINHEDSVCENEYPIYWIDFDEYNDRTYLVARQRGVNSELLFELVGGKLIRESKSDETAIHFHNGFVLDNHVIEFSGWHQWDGRFFVFNESRENGADLSTLRNSGYSLEFYIKNEDPSLRIDIKFESFIDRENWKLATFFYGFDGSEHRTDGTWERITVPFDTLDDWSDHAKDYWTMMNHVHFQISSTGGQPFSLKDIRIRKVLPE